MEKAYELGALVGELKANGLDVAEEGAIVAIKSVLKWLEDSAVKSENPYDNLLIPFYPIVRQKALEAADKIDGHVG